MDRFLTLVRTKTLPSVAGIVVVSLLIGYYIGREHTKYQIRSAVMGGLEELDNALNGGGTEAEEAEEEEAPVVTGEEPVTLTMTKKELVPVDYMAKKYSESIDFTVDLTNNTDKEIRAFEGVVHFRDLFEKKILDMSLTYEDGLKVGEKKAWDGTMEFNQFIDGHERLASIDLKDLQVRFEIGQVMYVDGTKEEF